MRLLRNISACLLALVGLIGWMLPVTVLANQTSLTVSPAIVEATIAAGDSQSSTITIFNSTEGALPIKTIMAPFTLGPDQEIAEGENRYDATEWLTIEPANLLIPPGETAEVQISYQVPEDAGPGGHYATVYFEPLVAVQQQSSGATAIAARVGVLVLLTVTGEAREEVLLAGMQKEVSAQTGEVTFLTQVDNTGNVHAMPNVLVQVRQWWGGRVAELTTMPALVMPGTSRQLKTAWSSPPAFGMYKVTALLNTDGSDQTAQQLSKRMIVIVRFTPLLVTVSAGLTSLVLLVNLVRYVKVMRSN